MVPALVIQEGLRDFSLLSVNLTLAWNNSTEDIDFNFQRERVYTLANLKLNDKTVSSTIEKPVTYGPWPSYNGLTLNPDNSLRLYDENYKATDDWSDGYFYKFESFGQLSYDLKLATLTLNFDNPEIPEDLRTILTKDFLFEGTMVQSLALEWHGDKATNFKRISTSKK